MKLSTILTIFGSAFVSSGTVAVPDSSDDVLDKNITDGAAPPTGEKIPGENSFNLCKGDRTYDAVCIGFLLFQSPALYLGNIWCLPEQCSLSTSS